ncbi:hypothetical protein D3C85_1235740 [compost metagenome]
MVRIDIKTFHCEHGLADRSRFQRCAAFQLILAHHQLRKLAFARFRFRHRRNHLPLAHDGDMIRREHHLFELMRRHNDRFAFLFHPVQRFKKLINLSRRQYRCWLI